jgi:protease IV
MKVYLKRFWGWAMTLKDGLALIALLLFFVVLFRLMSGGPHPSDTRGGALLVNLDGALVEQVESADPKAIVLGDAPLMAQTRGSDVIHALRTAAKDSDIKAVVLNLDRFIGGGQVLLQDVAGALDEVRAAKKPVLAFATGYSDDSYLLAAHASEVWLDPMGAVLLTGPGGTRPYFKGLIDRLGVNVHVYRVGKFKSFVEPYLLTKQSDEARSAGQALVDSIWGDWKRHVASARPQANIAPLLADPSSAGKDLAKAAIALKLVDKLGTETAFAQRVATLTGADEDKGPDDFNRTSLAAYLQANPPKSRGEKIGIVTVAGAIVDGQAPSGSAGGDTIAALIHSAVADEDMKALVVRVDSPGGSAFASEKIRLAMADARAKKLPVIVSMGNVAASGGYWVAMGGDKVFAEPATITGSIGVFGIIPTFETTAARYGVTTDGVKTTALSGQPDIIGGTSPETDRLLQNGVEDIYGRFLSLVSVSRKLPIEKVNELAQGRVWDGGAARQLGLVDAFGSLDDAVAEAAKRAGIEADDVQRVSIEPQPGFLTQVLASLGVHSEAALPRDIVSKLALRERINLMAGFADAGQVLTGPAVQVRCLSCPPSLRPVAQPTSFLSLFDRFFS